MDDPVLGIPNPKRKERHAVKDSLPERPQKKDKYSRTPMGVWCRSNSRRNCHLRIECIQLTFWPHWWGNNPWTVRPWLPQLTGGLGRWLMKRALEWWPAWSTNGEPRSTEKRYIMRGILQEWGPKKSRRKEKGEDGSNLHDLGNLCNLVLKEEEEH